MPEQTWRELQVEALEQRAEAAEARVAKLEAALSSLALNIRTALQFDSLDPAAARALRPVRDVIESLVGSSTIPDEVERGS